MILPPRPLRLRKHFVRRSLARVLISFAPMLALLLTLMLWQGQAAYGLIQDVMVWNGGQTVPARVLDSEVRVTAGVVRHVRVRAEFGRDVMTGPGYRIVDGQVQVLHTEEALLDTHYTVTDDYFTLLTDSVGDEPFELRREPGSGRVALSCAIRDAPGRAAWVLLYGAALFGMALFFGRYAWRGFDGLRVARAAARDSDEVELDVVSLKQLDRAGEPFALELTYEVPGAPRERPDGYRGAALAAPAVVTETFELARGRPILLDEDTRVLALRPDRRAADVSIVRRDLWPFALDDEAHALAVSRLLRRESKDA